MRSLRAVIWLAAFLALTGLALMLLYVPNTAASGQAVPAPVGVTPGGIFRGLHFWIAQVILLAAVLHLTRVVFVKTNRRYAAWAVAALALTGLLWFTGMLLPWDRLMSYLPIWAGGLIGVYRTHTLALSLLLLILLTAYTRRTRRMTTAP